MTPTWDRYERTRKAHAIGRIRLVSGRRKGGEMFPMELSVMEVPLEGGVRYAALIRDVSERTQFHTRACTENAWPPWGPPLRPWPTRSATPSIPSRSI